MKPLELPKLMELSDAELERFEPEEFANLLVDRARAFGADIMNKDHYRIEEFDEEEKTRRLIEWNRKHAWMEWWLGVPPPSKQITLLGDNELPLKVRIAQQVIDEVKHQEVFSRCSAHWGGSENFADYSPPESVWRAYQSTFYFEGGDPLLGIAISLQVTGEAVLLHHLDPALSVLNVVLDDFTREAYLQDIAPDELRHVNNGKEIIAKYARDPKTRRWLISVQNTKLERLAAHYVEDHALLGAYREAPLPVI